VPGEGPDKAALVVVGEAPGNTELRLKRPFVGPAGQLLDTVLHQAGIARAQCYITNAVQCMSWPTRTPKPDELKCCRQRLLSEVAARQPKVVLALGKVAMRSLLNMNKPISDERGTVRYVDQLDAHVIVTYHPAAVLRSPRLYRDMLADVTKAARALENPQAVVKTAAVEYGVIHNLDQLQSFIERHKDAQAIAYDVETASNGSLLCLGVSCEPGRAVVLSGQAVEDRRAKELLSAWMNRPGVVLIGHNSKYDRKVLWSNGFDGEFATGEDTMLMSYALDHSVGGHGLKQLVREELSFYEDYAAEVEKYSRTGFENCPTDILHRYNAHDAAFTLLLADRLNGRLDGTDRKLLGELLYPANDALAHMEHLGIMVDIPYLRELDQKLSVEVASLVTQLHAVAGVEFNPNSVPQLLDVMYKRLKLPVPAKLSTDKKALEVLLRFTDHPFPKLLQQYRERVKFHSTYVNALLDAADPNARVHTNFNLHVTATGRLSSSRPVNLQNIPRGSEARNIFIPTPGYVMLEADMSQSEVRVFALLSQDDALIGAIESGVDIHTATASLMFGLRPEDVTKDQRQAAKRLTFSTLYQQTAQGLAAELGCSVQEAVDLQSRFFAAYKKGQQWIQEVQQNALESGVYTTAFGRKLRYTVTPENRAEVLRWAVNYPVQSVSSDITLAALVRLSKKIKAGMLGDTRLLLTVHDSIVVETAEDPVEIARLIKNEMELDVLNSPVKFVAEVKAGQRWGALTVLELI